MPLIEVYLIENVFNPEHAPDDRKIDRRDSVD
jgi:hypothetical protein